ncbi:hypothetical protein J7E85_01660 [Paenibacillus sp. ISL-20]|nr:hypothetical protein [Paenibacillus sp. ISL-20]
MILEDKRFYHKEHCHPKLLKVKEVKKRENEQWDALFQYILQLHDIIVLPTGNISRLQDLRAGYTMRDGKKVRQWKTGPDFALMLDAYKLAEDSIKWCIVNKLDGSNDVKAINYGISIMIDKLNEANDRRKLKMRQQQTIQSNQKDDQLNKNTEIKYKKRSENNDISDFL